MLGLTEACRGLDDLHFSLHEKYAGSLAISRPEYGFLREDCFLPSGEEECYGVFVSSFELVLDLLEKLQVSQPQAVHPCLRSLQNFIDIFQKLPQPEKTAPWIKDYDKLQSLCLRAIRFIQPYRYKLGAGYRANTAILIAAMLYRSSAAARRPNIDVTVPVVQNKINAAILNLNQIATKVCAATKRGSRTLQFIAIGIAKDGSLWITSNDRSPAIYPFDCFMTNEAYAQAEKYRSLYKTRYRTGGSGALSVTMHRIHAETIMAALSEALGIEQIVIVDGAGKKVENCPCCAHYLCIHGFTSQPHVDEVRNYTVPNKAHIKAAADFALALKEKFPGSAYQSALPKAGAAEFRCSAQARADALSYLEIIRLLLPYSAGFFGAALDEVFAEIKQAYPMKLGTVVGLSDTYHQARKLAEPDSTVIDRVVVRRARTSSRHPNTALTLLDDGSLRVSTKRGNRALSPERPASPRSQALAEYANAWLAKKDGRAEKVNRSGTNVIDLVRG